MNTPIRKRRIAPLNEPLAPEEKFDDSKNTEYVEFAPAVGSCVDLPPDSDFEYYEEFGNKNPLDWAWVPRGSNAFEPSTTK